MVMARMDPPPPNGATPKTGDVISPRAATSATAPAASPTSPIQQLPADSAARAAKATVLGSFIFSVLLSIAVFPQTWLSMLQVWRHSETFTHGFIALPCAAWMMWSRRNEWSQLPLRTWWPGLLLLALAGLGWLLGQAAGVASVEQLGAVALIPSVMALLLGPTVMWALAFPMIFLFFAVPIGDFLTPIMMQYTADATVLALQWTGVPVYREGMLLTVPSGRWSVVEACSGLRYLIASVALGVLFAYLQFRTLRYRLGFVALSIVMPVVANWIRAYMIVMIGHLSDMRLAAGADHLIYGWVFFGAVMLLLFWIGTRWREPAATASAGTAATVDHHSKRSHAGLSGRRIGWALAAVVLAFALRPTAASMFNATEPVDAEAVFRQALAGMPTDDRALPPWAPTYTDARSSLHTTVTSHELPVKVFADYYALQHRSTEMIHNNHRLMEADDPPWRVLGSSSRQQPWGKVTELRVAYGNTEMLLWHWYEVGGSATPSAYVAKALTATSLLAGRGDHSISVALGAPVPLDQSPEATRQALADVGARIAAAATSLSRGEMPTAASTTASSAPGRSGEAPDTTR